jgi:hypothetical protein
MRAGLLLLGLSTFAIAATQTPPKALLEEINTVVHARFADVKDGNFGNSRMGEPFNTHSYRDFEAKSPAEKKLIDALKSEGWQGAVYTVRLNGPKSAAGRSTFRRLYNGPVKFGATADRNAPLPRLGAPIHKDFDRIALAAREGKAGPFSYRGWTYYSEAVKANSKCVSCHVDSKGKPVKVGDTIGYFLIGLHKSGDNP